MGVGGNESQVIHGVVVQVGITVVSPDLQTHPVVISLTQTCILEMDAPSGWHRHQDERYHSGRGHVEASNIALPPIKVVNKKPIFTLRGNGRH